MSRSRDLANLANNASGLETLTVSDITDLTATATELNKLNGVTATTAELNYTGGVDSAIQTQINSKIGNSNPTVTLGSNAVFPSGHIIQCQFVHMTGPWNHNSTTLTLVTDGSNSLEKAITPIKASSKILVMLSCSLAGGDSSTQGYLQLQRKVASGSYSAIGGGSDTGSHRNSALGQASTYRVEATNQIGYHFFDSPSYSVGEAITYKIMGAGQHPSYYIYVGQARQSGDATYISRMPATLTLLEIAN